MNARQLESLVYTECSNLNKRMWIWAEAVHIYENYEGSKGNDSIRQSLYMVFPGKQDY